MTKYWRVNPNIVPSSCSLLFSITFLILFTLKQTFHLQFSIVTIYHNCYLNHQILMGLTLITSSPLSYYLHAPGTAKFPFILIIWYLYTPQCFKKKYLVLLFQIPSILMGFTHGTKTLFMELTLTYTISLFCVIIDLPNIAW